MDNDLDTLATALYVSRGPFENTLKEGSLTLLRPTRKGEKPRPATEFFKPLRQIIESVNDTLKGQLDLEAHGGRTIAGVTIRVLQRILALTAAIWHNCQHRTTPPTITDRIRPLTPWNQSSSNTGDGAVA